MRFLTAALICVDTLDQDNKHQQKTMLSIHSHGMCCGLFWQAKEHYCILQPAMAQPVAIEVVPESLGNSSIKNFVILIIRKLPIRLIIPALLSKSIKSSNDCWCGLTRDMLLSLPWLMVEMTATSWPFGHNSSQRLEATLKSSVT